MVLPLGKVPRHDRALRGSQGLKVRLGNVGRKVICGEGFSSNEDLHLIAFRTSSTASPAGNAEAANSSPDITISPTCNLP